jgi:subtilisin family serine protease
MDALRRLAPALCICLLAAPSLLRAGGAAAGPGAPASPAGGAVEVVVTLPQLPLSRAAARDRGLAAAVRRHHALDVRTPAAVSYLRTLAAAQRRLQARLSVAVPAARVRWHYGVALDGVSVVVPRSELPRLEALRGVTVWPTTTYRALRSASPAATGAPALDRTPSLIGAPSLWGPDLATAGQGMRIAIVDDGIDQTHPFFDPSGFAYPPGFPKGNRAFTTPKVIVARAFPSPSTTWKYAARPFDPEYSEHGTHVAGIAAGDHDTLSNGPRGRVRVSGIAPKAYLGNYKVLTVPTEDYGLDGNAPEIAKAIDQAVRDGMNVINLSIGEPEIEPSRDVVVAALDNAAAAGVVSAVAAGNEFDETGHGSISSPANAPATIAVAAASEGGDGPADEIASFSSAGPSPISLLLKPDVTAPGEGVLSSIPHDAWDVWDGTSMAAPHVAGAAALLLQRHPTWTVEQVKSSLESTGAPVHVAGSGTEVTSSREGGGRIALAAADQPLVFTDPASLSWGLVRRGFVGTQRVLVSDAGGGLAPWTVSVAVQSAPAGVTVRPDAGTVTPGTTLGVTVAVAKTAAAGDANGFVVLSRSGANRRIPFWLHVEVPRLAGDRHTTITHPGLYRGDTAGRRSRVTAYRYPEQGVAAGVPTSLAGPEQVYRFTLRRRVANFGAVVLARRSGVRVSPRLVHAGDENRLVGNAGLPAAINPYQGIPHPYPVVAAILPVRGTYDLVFDTPTGAKPGRFLFRFWVNDVTPPTVKLLHSTVRAGEQIRLAVRDGGSGVDPQSLAVARDGVQIPFTYAHGIVSVDTTTTAPGSHRIRLTAADYQETKNMEDVGPVLPNTRVFRATVDVRP